MGEYTTLRRSRKPTTEKRSSKSAEKIQVGVLAAVTGDNALEVNKLY